jgi:hypothetical protein
MAKRSRSEGYDRRKGSRDPSDERRSKGELRPRSPDLPPQRRQKPRPSTEPTTGNTGLPDPPPGGVWGQDAGDHAVLVEAAATVQLELQATQQACKVALAEETAGSLSIFSKAYGSMMRETKVYLERLEGSGDGCPFRQRMYGFLDQIAVLKGWLDGLLHKAEDKKAAEGETSRRLDHVLADSKAKTSPSRAETPAEREDKT